MKEVNEETIFNASSRFRILPVNAVSNLPNSTTPDVQNVEFFNAGGFTVTVTNFKFGAPGQKLYILGDGKLTVANNSNIETIGGANHVLLNGKMYLFIFMGSKWKELDIKGFGYTLFYNPKDFGAKGDGSNADYAAYAATYTAAIANKGVVIIENTGSFYAINGTISVNGPVTTLGFNKPELRFSNNATYAFEVTSSDVEFDGIYCKGRQYTSQVVSEDCFRIHGVDASNYIHNVKIKNCKIEQFGFYGIYGEFVEQFEFKSNDIDNINYAGIMNVANQYGNIEDNDINTVLSIIAGTGYGIACTRQSITSLVTSPRSKHIRVYKNRVYNITGWEAYDTHAGEDIQFIGNYCYNCKWGLNIGPCPDSLGTPAYAPINCHAINNVFDSGKTDGSCNAGIIYTGAGISLGVVAEWATGGIIAHNTLIGYGDQAGTNSGAIVFYTSKGTKVADNQCIEPGNAGILAYVDNEDFSITGNVVTDVWSNALTNPTGFWVRAGNNEGYIGGNRLARSTKTATYINVNGAQISNSAGNLIRRGDNDLWAATSFVWLDSGKKTLSYQPFDMAADMNNSDVTLVAGVDRAYQTDDTTLTAERNVTVSLAVNSIQTLFYFRRTAGGDFDRVIKDSVVGEITRLRQNQWCAVGYDNGQMKTILRGNLTSAEPIKTITTNTTLNNYDKCVLIDCSGGNVTATLPLAGNCKGIPFELKRIDTSGNTCTIATGAGNIDGSATQLLAAYQAITVKSDGTNFWIVSV